MRLRKLKLDESPRYARYSVEALESRTLLAGLTGQYFDRVDFTGLKVTRTDPVVDFTWAAGPDPAVAGDFFSARWTGQVEAQFGETYTFYVNSDDGARLWVDGRLLIDNWVNQLPTEKSAAVELEAGKRYDIRLDYYEANQGAAVKLSWSSPHQAKQVMPSARLFTAPAGLKATYYDNADFTNPQLSRVDGPVSFDWGTGSPTASIGADTFAVRWSGQVLPQFSQTYTFYATTDAGATSRLRVNGELLVDSSSDQDGGQIKLEAGKLYDIKLEYAEDTGAASVRLEWSSPSQAKQVIPAARLFASAETAIPLRRADYTNSVLNADRPDPGVIFADGFYWMVHTTGGPNVGWPLYKSSDMTSWTFVTHLLTSSNKPAFMTDSFWAPEIHRIGNQFVITGTSWSSTYGHLVIALGTASEIGGPYTVQSTPIVSDTRHVLDSNIFQDDDGRVYFLWKRDGPSNGQFGTILIREMNATGTAFAAGSTATVILDNSVAGWERNLAEAPWMIRRGANYYLFYSGGFIDTTYSVGVARGTSPLGPFTRSAANPIIRNNTTWAGPGHGGFAKDADGTIWHLYHARPQSNPDFGRVQMLDKVVWTADLWPTFGNGGTPSVTFQPGPRVHANSGVGRIEVLGDASTADSNDTFRVVRNTADSALLDVILNGVTMRSVRAAEIEMLTIDGRGGNDTLILDYARGEAIPGAGITFLASAGFDTVRVIGAGAADTFRHGAGQLTHGTGIAKISAEKLAVENGNFQINADLGAITVDVMSGAVATFSVTQHLAALNVLTGGVATLAAGGTRLLRTNALSIVAGARLDLADNDLLVDYTGASPYSTVRGYVVTGRNTGTGGIVSTPGAGDVILAVVDNTLFGRTIWNGEAIDATTLIGKYTYYGDANLDGRVTGDDYLAVDSNLGISPGTRQWIQGDFNFDAAVTGDDYLAIDANLGKGTTNPLAWTDEQDEMIALHAEEFGGKSYVTSVEAAAAGTYRIGTKKTAKHPR